MLAMGSPRSDQRFATWLALFALGVQMVVSFGHVHLEGIARTDQARVASGAAAHTSQSLLGQPPSSGDDADAYCPICASVYLTANSFVPAVPVLRPPSASSAVENIGRAARVFIAPRRLAFQSRAPPPA
jgi:hypothetical protein